MRARLLFLMIALVQFDDGGNLVQKFSNFQAILNVILNLQHVQRIFVSPVIQSITTMKKKLTMSASQRISFRN